ncbi:hypothetical protein OG589_14635 [Sphaerisporangium sp. NBC_01403]|uniref:hypothetical protein n=1 Tax=Sphaerisporangium sp. NBC_01403 TaxID=2903599 RepID=UPI00325216E5
MTDYQLTPAEQQKLDRRISMCRLAALAIAGASLILFAVAVWFTDWRYAGLAVIALVPAGFLLVVVAEAEKPSVQRKVAERLRRKDAVDVSAGGRDATCDGTATCTRE